MARNLIIVEGAQGVGKGTITTALRSRLTCTNLMSLAGLPIDSTAYQVFRDRKTEMNSILLSNNLGWILDRSYITDLVYQRMEKKPYSYNDFECYRDKLDNQLVDLTWNYNVYLVLLKASEDEFARRLFRPDKATYENMIFSTKSSMTQQSFYDIEFDRLNELLKTKAKNNFKVLKVDTTSNPEDAISYIMEAINVKEK